MRLQEVGEARSYSMSLQPFDVANDLVKQMAEHAKTMEIGRVISIRTGTASFGFRHRHRCRHTSRSVVSGPRFGGDRAWICGRPPPQPTPEVNPETNVDGSGSYFS